MKVLSKEVKIENNEVVIQENIERVLTLEQLEMKLRDINQRKLWLQEQNNKLIADYNGLLQEETEIKDYINQLSADNNVENLENIK